MVCSHSIGAFSVHISRHDVRVRVLNIILSAEIEFNTAHLGEIATGSFGLDILKPIGKPQR
jgi:hypothetical protein